MIYSQASRAQILNKATDYIQFMRRKNHSHQVSAIIVCEQNDMNYYIINIIIIVVVCSYTGSLK